MNPLVTQIAGAVVPHPVPFVVEAIRIKGTLGSRAKPEIVIHASGDRSIFFNTDALAQFIAEAAREANLTYFHLMDMADRLLRGFAGTRLCPCLADTPVLRRCLHQPSSLRDIVADGLFHID